MTDEAASLAPLTDSQRTDFAWLDEPFLKKAVAALEAARPESARFVGGCVRDSLLGQTPKDFDIATPLTPDAVIAALKAAGLRYAPTGLAHGTVTAIVDHHGVEITTLRADVSTDGRRATVAFTEDWSVDAGRRDFTVNAIYLTPAGALYDPVGGLADIEQKRVRFIGDPAGRIEEDFLRILRFFRFTARFAVDFDSEGLAACGALKSGIGRLSAERIGAEMMQILRLTKAPFALDAMARAGVLAEIWDSEPDLNAARRAKALRPDALGPVMLAVLYAAAGDGLGSALRLSNAENAARKRALEAAADLKPDLSPEEIRRRIYAHGRDAFDDGALVAAATGKLSEQDFDAYVAANNAWRAPEFPVSGKDALAAGLEPGPAVSEVLDAVEARWIDAGFPAAEAARAMLAEEIAARRG